MLPANLHRPNISREIADSIREMIVSRELSPGERINEVHLARRMGISRTPLREALFSLVNEGALDMVPRRGFFVTPLSVEELRNIYPIRALLDPAALRLAGIPDAATLARLKSMNARLGRARSVEARISADDDWHRTLIAGCDNFVLIDLIEQFIRRTHRYEHGYMGERSNVETAMAEHARILAALRARDLDAACTLLEQNLSTGLTSLLEWTNGLDTSRRAQ